MNLTVRMLIESAAWLRLVLIKIADMHRNHGSFLLLDVYELNQSLFQSIIEVHTLTLLRFQVTNVPLAHEHFVVLDNEQRPLHSTSICVEPNFFVGDVANDGHFFGDLVATTQLLDTLEEVIWIIMRPKPVAIDEDFDVFAVPDHRLIPLFELFDTEILQD